MYRPPPLDDRRQDRAAWLLLAMVSTYLLVEILPSLLARWLWGRP